MTLSAIASSSSIRALILMIDPMGVTAKAADVDKTVQDIANPSVPEEVGYFIST